MAEFSNAQKAKLREKFNFFDKDKSGELTIEDLRKVASQLGYTEEDCKRIMDTRDTDKSGTITFEEFCAGLKSVPKESRRTAEIREKFRLYDADGNGLVDTKEAHAILSKELGFSPEATDRFMKRYGSGDGKVDYKGFVKLYARIDIKKSVLEDIFKDMDQDGSGTLSAEEVAEHMKDQEGFSEDEVRDFIKLHDKNNDGQLDYTEFVTFWQTFKP